MAEVCALPSAILVFMFFVVIVPAENNLPRANTAAAAVDRLMMPTCVSLNLAVLFVNNVRRIRVFAGNWRAS